MISLNDNFVLGLHRELVVDNFAGGGGASTGIELALGRCVDHAINHSAEALGMHRINHPQTIHHCEDVFDVDPAALTEGRPVGLGWFSPDCKHFSKAKGGKPLDKKIRGLVLVMIRWAASVRPRVFMMENVEEIQTWGPLGADNRPAPAHKGRTWRAFLAIMGSGIEPGHPDLPEILEVLNGTKSRLPEITAEQCHRGFGYAVETRELRACDYGAPTIRKRLFAVFRCDGLPIVWPRATHAGARREARGAGESGKRLKPWRTIGECIDWDLPCPSIFLEGAAAKAARCKRPLVPATLRRVATGIDRYVLKAKRPFLVSLTHQGGERVESVDAPAGTITGAHRGEKAVVSPTVTRFSGNHAGKTDGAGRGQDMREPLKTQDTSNRFGVVQADLVAGETGSPGGSQGGRLGRPPGKTGFLTEHANARNQRNCPADEPVPTLCAEVKGGHFALVSGTVVGAGGPAYKGKPVGVDRPGGAQTTENHSALAAASMVKLRGDVASHNRPQDLNAPVGTVSAGGQHHAVGVATLVETPTSNLQPPENHQASSSKMAAHLTKFCTGSTGQAADEPISTICSGSHSEDTHGGAASTHGVVMGSLAAYYGNDEDGQGVQEPARTVTTRERFGFVESRASSWPGLSPEQLAGARRVAAFLREYGVEFDGELATVTDRKTGTVYVIVDIGMRMLTPRELFRAQGFPEHYVIDRAWLIDPVTGSLQERALTKEEKIRMCGNSVCPPVARALVAANVPGLAVQAKMGKLSQKARRATPQGVEA